MTGPKDRPKIPRRALAETVADPVLTSTLAKRVRRDVALESAEQEVDATAETAEAPVAVVIGPDGVPLVADLEEVAPVTVRVDPKDHPVLSGKLPRKP